ncbi:MAG: hypothetical protein BWY95_01311 [Bacteroidetes bacterium ADurb.BinA104]|nr:MAG: hypothetical protein BWY95_01311 [Bacteroidetes bacterium ADurb.BinA104]
MSKDGGNLFIKLSLRKALKEVASLVAKYFWLNNQHTIYSSLYYFHLILSLNCLYIL